MRMSLDAHISGDLPAAGTESRYVSDLKDRKGMFVQKEHSRPKETEKTWRFNAVLELGLRIGKNKERAVKAIIGTFQKFQI